MSATNRHSAIYARASSRTQDTKSQEPELERWAELSDTKTIWYRDNASGTTMDRPAWNRLEKAVRSGKVGTIVVWRLDRLGRNVSKLSALFDELNNRKINLISLKEGFDLSTPAGRLMANMLASMAQFETEIRSERQRAGIASARASGKRWGGSKKGERTKVTPEQERSIRRLHEEGTPITRIAKAVGLSRPTIYKVLRR